MKLFRTIKISIQLWWRFHENLESFPAKAVCPCDEAFMKLSRSANVGTLGKTIEFFMKLKWNCDDAIFTWLEVANILYYY